jgi:PAS domain S-box-containing protein
MADKELKDLMMRTLLERLEELLFFSSGPINYEMLARAFKELSGALFTAVSTYENDRKESLTRAFSGPPELINQACTILGFNPVGKRGPLASKDLTVFENNPIVSYANLTEASRGLLPEDVSSSMSELLPAIGEMHIIGLACRGGEPLGDALIFMPRGKALQNREAVQIYADHLGSLLLSKESERRLRHSETNFRRMAESMGEVFWLRSNDNQRMLYISPAYENVWGRSCKSLYDKPESFIESVHQEDLATVIAEYERYSREGIFNLEYRIVRPDGNIRWVWARSFPVIDEKNRLTGHSGIAVDITGRKKMEVELEMKSNILTATLQSTNELLSNPDYRKAISTSFQWLGDSVGVDRIYLFENTFSANGNLTHTSQIIEWSAGIVEPQLDNPDLQDVAVEDVAFFIEPLAQKKPFRAIISELPKSTVRDLLSAQQILSILVLPVFIKDFFWGFIGYDECKFEREWTAVEYALLQSFTGTIASAIQRSRMEEELEQSIAAAEEANIAKRNFLANMSHEIRTPFSGVLGMVELLDQTSLSSEQKEYVGHIKSSTRSLLNIIDDILDISKIEAGILQLSSDVFEVKGFIEKIMLPFHPAVAAKSLDLSWSVSDNLPEFLFGDFNKIRQVIINLVSNAIKFTGSGYIRLVVSGERDSSNSAILTFVLEDSGTGIPSDKLKSVFSPFTQADETISRQFGGTGLGLFICKNLVELMGGEISLKSRPNQGTTVTFTLPLLIAEGFAGKDSAATGGDQPEVVVQAAKNPKSQQYSILVAEDDKVNRLIISRVLEKAGHTVCLATNGLEALEKFEKQTFDLILMDIQMPLMDGYAATTAMRNLEQDKSYKTPIVALTAHAMTRDREKSIAAGMNDHLTKPVQTENLLRLIENLPVRELREVSSPLSDAYQNEDQPSMHKNFDQLFHELQEDLAFMEKMAHEFKTSSEMQLADLKIAAAKGDAEQFRFNAHKLKGALAVLRAEKAGRMAAELEMMGQSQDLAGAAELLQQFEEEIGLVIENLFSYIMHTNK